jgi:hypothetical protein
MADASVVLSRLWALIRQDDSVETFESWLFACEELEHLLGVELYLETISTPFGVPEAVDGIRSRLEEFARRHVSFRCECIALPKLALVDMGHHEHVFRTLGEARRRGAPFWWLSLDVCQECDQAWLVASEERQNDVYLLQRVSDDERVHILERDVWPSSFDSYEALLIIGRTSGRSVRWVDPIDSSSVRATVTDLARARPGIAVGELSLLLNLEPEIVRKIARELVAEEQLHVLLDR